MPIRSIIEGGRVPVKVFTDEIDERSRQQFANVAQLPIAFGHVAAMPDVHAGMRRAVFHRAKDTGVLDEIPGAHKDIDRVMAGQTDLVEVVHTLKQIVCVKG